jgi:sporulation protein YlmC with PRC-barrel domain
MMLKTGASVAALAFVLGTAPAMAQTTSPQQPTAPSATKTPAAPLEGQILVQDANTLLAKEFIGQPIYASDKTKIGTLSDLILSKDGKTVEAFVIGTGGFLGMGEKGVALKMDRLQLSHDPQAGLQLVVNVKKEELANAPSFKSISDQKSEQQAVERTRNQPGQQSRPQRQ